MEKMQITVVVLTASGTSYLKYKERWVRCVISGL